MMVGGREISGVRVCAPARRRLNEPLSSRYESHVSLSTPSSTIHDNDIAESFTVTVRRWIQSEHPSRAGYLPGRDGLRLRHHI